MDTQLEPHRRSPKTPGRFIGQLAWTLLWLVAAFFMLVAGLVGLNFVVVGLLSFFVDLGEWGPRLGGELAEAVPQKVAFIIVGIAVTAASIIFFWLNARNRSGAAVLLFVVLLVTFWGLGWITGIHDLSGGVGSMSGFGGR
jgi:hypothetical protein